MVRDGPWSTALSASATALVESTLLAPASGLGVVAGSASYAGAATASGTFTNGGTGSASVGIATGVVLTRRRAVHRQQHGVRGDDANKTGESPPASTTR